MRLLSQNKNSSCNRHASIISTPKPRTKTQETHVMPVFCLQIAPKISPRPSFQSLRSACHLRGLIIIAGRFMIVRSPSQEEGSMLDSPPLLLGEDTGIESSFPRLPAKIWEYDDSHHMKVCSGTSCVRNFEFLSCRIGSLVSVSKVTPLLKRN